MSDDYIKKLEQAYDNMAAKDYAARKKGTLLGRYINEQYADGYAYYEIVKVNTKTVRIRWLDIWDGWTIPFWGKEANISREYAEQRVGGRDRLNDLLESQNRGKY